MISLAAADFGPFAVETVGYVGRALSHYNKTERGAYIMQALLILVAPALFAATIYMTLGRLIRAMHAEKHSIIKVTWLTKLFVTGDAMSFFIQGAGGGIMAGGSSNSIKLGQDIILVGLFLQITLFSFFVLAAIIFHFRTRQYPTEQSREPALPWEKIIWVLYAVSALILVRNIFRVAEYIGGRNGYLLSTEWPIYVFDAVLMAVTMATLFWWYPNMTRPKETCHLESLESHSVKNVDA